MTTSDGWHPIEDGQAPKDGTKIDVWVVLVYPPPYASVIATGKRVADVWWRDGGRPKGWVRTASQGPQEVEFWNHAVDGSRYVTHWRHRPAPPETVDTPPAQSVADVDGKPPLSRIWPQQIDPQYLLDVQAELVRYGCDGKIGLTEWTPAYWGWRYSVLPEYVAVCLRNDRRKADKVAQVFAGKPVAEGPQPSRPAEQWR